MRTLDRTALLVFAIAASWAHADEGFYTFDSPPIQRVLEDHGVALYTQWLDHLRLACASPTDGGSGSFVSKRGLILTNYHLVADWVCRASDAEHNLLDTGFHARTEADELPLPGLSIRVLRSIRDVTSRVSSSVPADATPEVAARARRSEIARIEAEASTGGYAGEVVSLDCGLAYKLHEYQSLDDVRLVFAPEARITEFGGKFDNFSFPRFSIDIALLRAYDHGVPFQPPSFLRVSRRGVSDGEVVFAAGNPGSTARRTTSAELEFLLLQPSRLASLTRVLQRMKTFEGLGLEQRMRAYAHVRRAENSYKILEFEAEPREWSTLLSARESSEQQLLECCDEESDREQLEEAFRRAADPQLFGSFPEPPFLDWPFSSSLARLAQAVIVRAQELEKPESERLPPYRQCRLPRLDEQLLTWPSVDAALDSILFTEDLVFLGRGYPTDEHAVMLSLSPLNDVEKRGELINGSPDRVANSRDPLIVLVSAIESELSDWKMAAEQLPTGVDHPLNQIAAIRARLTSAVVYPEPNDTLRFSYGCVKGYSGDGRRHPCKTTFAGLYDRHDGFDGKSPFDLPDRYINGRERIDCSTPLDFVSTVDNVGGSSGSPVVNRDGELVGVEFDGNRSSLELDFQYSDEQARAIAVDVRAIIEVLGKLYDAPELVRELMGQ